MLRSRVLFASMLALASVLLAPGAAHAVVNGTFTVTGGNQNQVGQSTITLTNTATHQTVQVTSSTNGNKKTFGFILPDGGTYTMTGTAGGQPINQTFTVGGNGTVSGGVNIDFNTTDPMHGNGIATAGGGTSGPCTAGSCSLSFYGGGAPNPATTPIFGIGGGMGFESNNVDVNLVGSFFKPQTMHVSQTNAEVVGQIFGSIPAGALMPSGSPILPGTFLQADANLAIPFSGTGTSNAFNAMPVGGGSTPGNTVVQQTGVDFTLKGGPGMVFPQFANTRVTIEGGVNFKSFIATMNIPGVGDNFNGTVHTIQPVVGFSAAVPVSLLFPFVTNQLGFDTGLVLMNTSYQHEFSGGTERMNSPGSNSFSSGTMKFTSGDQFMLTVEVPFGGH